MESIAISTAIKLAAVTGLTSLLGMAIRKRHKTLSDFIMLLGLVILVYIIIKYCLFWKLFIFHKSIWHFV